LTIFFVFYGAVKHFIHLYSNCSSN